MTGTVRVSADKATANALTLPDLTLWEVGNADNHDFTVQQRIRVVPLEEARSILAVEASAAAIPGTLQVAEFQKSVLQKTRTMTHIFWGMNGGWYACQRLLACWLPCSSAGYHLAQALQNRIQLTQNTPNSLFQVLEMYFFGCASTWTRARGTKFRPQQSWVPQAPATQSSVWVWGHTFKPLETL